MKQYNLIAIIITKQNFYKGYTSYADDNIQVFISGIGQSKSSSQDVWCITGIMRCTVKINQL